MWWYSTSKDIEFLQDSVSCVLDDLHQDLSVFDTINDIGHSGKTMEVQCTQKEDTKIAHKMIHCAQYTHQHK